MILSLLFILRWKIHVDIFVCLLIMSLFDIHIVRATDKMRNCVITQLKQAITQLIFRSVRPITQLPERNTHLFLTVRIFTLVMQFSVRKLPK